MVGKNPIRIMLMWENIHGVVLGEKAFPCADEGAEAHSWSRSC